MLSSHKSVKWAVTAIAVITAMMLVSAGAQADIINVPGDQPTIQAGIDAAVNGDEVIVADGVYTGPGNRDLDFNGKLITVRSANGPDNCIIDCQGTEADPHRGFHFHSGETSDAVVQGFTIRNGRALPDGFMGGRHGGAIYCDFNSNPTINKCTITDNSAFHGGGIMCGSDSGSSPTITNCTISDNSADRGSGIYSYNGSPAITNCIISGNTAVGGPDEEGGGIYCSTGSTATITNCTITGNAAGDGGGIYFRFTSGRVTLTNCILWANVPDQISDVNDHSIVTFSNVQGGWPGTSNIDADPLFVDPVGGDYHISGGSPCIDAADNTAVPKGIVTDLDGNPRFVDDPASPDCWQAPGMCGDPPVVDMGAYEFQAITCPWDLDGDVSVGILDLLALLAAWGTDPGGPPDFDGDGTVGILDLLALIANWGKCP